MNYIDLINNYWDLAPEIDGYKPQYSCLYFGIIDSINRNFWKETSIEYDRIISKTGMDKRMYLEAREWLKNNGFIDFIAGKNNYSPAKYRIQNCTTNAPSIVPLPYLNSTTTVPSNVPIIIEDNKQETKKQRNNKQFSNENLASNKNHSYQKKVREGSIYGDGELDYLCVEFYQKNPNKYTAEMYKEFLTYWTAPIINGSKKDLGKELWRTHKTFQISGRLSTWHQNNLKRGGISTQQTYDKSKSVFG